MHTACRGYGSPPVCHIREGTVCFRGQCNSAPSCSPHGPALPSHSLKISMEFVSPKFLPFSKQMGGYLMELSLLIFLQNGKSLPILLFVDTTCSIQQLCKMSGLHQIRDNVSSPDTGYSHRSMAHHIAHQSLPEQSAMEQSNLGSLLQWMVGRLCK